ncbi:MULTISPECIES: cell division protein FtsQ/DivIB [Rhodopseudomonas]|uniref:Cell division protein FtsQ n=1 Tax=Rhodopseudomonas palustris TaxID=1076 RepID=A0A0D7EP05_RHOPL|nr:MULTISPECIES: cell division protein FtsQ/DivIB [Rhodopseudomonas]KIZ42270.1 cell division protein FtsQ [Rhodopseudomonas palustris]MDF3810226.1 FtsQ-type POTRA domain-containing protein [Rhodopseudomonas sp. BAL398]WOK18320.1 FtsQ-type POTRA domain-containing protein [Rhodopseudomonas sp. BAL398]
MDGGGRLARSLRLLGLRAELVKAAAVGALILLRARLAAPRRAAIAAPVNRPQPTDGLTAFVEKYLPRRVGIAATVLILLGSASLGVVKGGHLDEVTEALSDARNAVANVAGFRIVSVAITGRKQLTQDEILAIGGVNGRSSLLFLDPAVVRDKLRANPWIADATVLKLYPGQLQIDITERTAFARWQLDGRLSVIADDGAVLEPYVARRFATLPLVVGKGAGKRAKDFLALLTQYPQLASDTRAVILVGERRWNVRLKNGLDIKLPEHDAGNALATLMKFDEEDRLLSRDIVAIDLRLPDRLSVRLSDDAAKAREEQFKDKKSKKKAGEA